MKKGIKVLIIGYGSIGKRHAEVLSSLDIIDEIHIVSQYSKTDSITYKSLDEIIDINYYDYFVIASITSKHLIQLSYIDERVQDKIVLVEKPLALNYVDISVNNKVFVAYNLRFHPIMSALKDLVSNKKVISINIQTGQYLPTWRPGSDYSKSYSASLKNGGGVLLDLSHEIDYLLWLLGDVKSIDSIYGKFSDLNIESDDFVTAIGVLKTGTIFNFSMDYISKFPIRRIVVNTNDETILVDFISNSISLGGKGCSVPNIRKYCSSRNDSYINMHRAVLANIENDAATLEDGLKVMNIVEKIRGKINE